MFGCFKARAAYVPMDPSLPQDRLDYIAEDSGVRLIVINSDSSKIKSSNHLSLIHIDELFQDCGQRPTIEKGDHSDLAYIIYTSGSTGRPKGVEVSHKGLGPMLDYLRDHLFRSQKHVVYQFASLNFDVSVSDIFGTICNGSTLFVEDVNPVFDRSWIDSINKFGITGFSCSPSLLNTIDPADIGGVRLLLAGRGGFHRVASPQVESD